MKRLTGGRKSTGNKEYVKTPTVCWQARLSRPVSESLGVFKRENSFVIAKQRFVRRAFLFLLNHSSRHIGRPHSL